MPKIKQTCPNCNSVSQSPQSPVIFIDKVERMVQVWRYCCASCKWYWADLPQREHNQKQLNKAIRRGQGIYA